MAVIIGGPGGSPATLSSIIGLQGPNGWAIDPTVTSYGMVADAITVNDGAINGGTATLTATTSAPFKPAHVGKVCVVAAAGTGQIAAPTLSLGTTSSTGAGTGGLFTTGPTRYYWVVTAVNAYGESVVSNEVNASVPAGGSQTLTWTAVSGAVSYIVYRSTTSGSYSKSFVIPPGTSWVDQGFNSVTVNTPPTGNRSAAPLVTTIAAYVSPTQVTLAATATVTQSGTKVTVGTDNTAALQAALDAQVDVADVFLDLEAHQLVTRGGGTVLIPPGVYALAGNVNIPPRTRLSGYGATIIAVGASAGFTVPTAYPAYITSFASDNLSLDGLTFDGNHVATSFITMQASDHGSLRDVDVVRTVGDAMVLNGVQWYSFTNLTIQGCGGWAIRVQPYDPTGGRAPWASDLTFVETFLQANLLGGITMDTADGCNFFGLTSQFHATGTGVKLNGSCVQNQFFGGHFESNYIGIDNTGLNTVMTAPFFIPSQWSYRFVKNSGFGMRLISPGFLQSSLMMLGGAAFEQNSVNGNMVVFSPHRVTGLTLFIDDTGTVIDPALGRLARPYQLSVYEADRGQNASTFWATQTFKPGSGNSGARFMRDTDTGARLSIDQDGGLSWGPGDGTSDAAITRISAGALGVNGNLRPAGTTQTLGVAGGPWPSIYFGKIFPNQCVITSGSGSPNGVVTANPGSLYTDYSGGAGAVLYVKESGTGNTGWVAK